jgi:hypothetical protein
VAHAKPRHGLDESGRAQPGGAGDSQPRAYQGGCTTTSTKPEANAAHAGAGAQPAFPGRLPTVAWNGAGVANAGIGIPSRVPLARQDKPELAGARAREDGATSLIPDRSATSGTLTTLCPVPQRSPGCHGDALPPFECSENRSGRSIGSSGDPAVEKRDGILYKRSCTLPGGDPRHLPDEVSGAARERNFGARSSFCHPSHLTLFDTNRT